MFNMFKNKGKQEQPEPTCVHDYELVGKFFEYTRSDYTNGSDTVRAYKKHKCSHCGDTYDKTVVMNRYALCRFESHKLRDDFIKKLQSNGYISYDEWLISK